MSQSAKGFCSHPLGTRWVPYEYFESGAYKKVSKGQYNTGSHNKLYFMKDRAKRVDEGILIVRFELPFDIWCSMCGEHVAMGIRFNAEKTQVGTFHSTPIFSFEMKCPFCDNRFTMQTDPENKGYLVICGAKAKVTHWDGSDDPNAISFHSSEDRVRMAADPMFRLEKHAEEEQTLAQTTLKDEHMSDTNLPDHASNLPAEPINGVTEPPTSGPVAPLIITRMSTTDLREWYRTPPESASICMLSIQVGSQTSGQLGIRLFDHALPRTCENFRRLCIGEPGRNQPNGRPYHYKGTLFTRLQRNRFIVGGNIHGDGPEDKELHTLLPPGSTNTLPLRFKPKGKGKGKASDERKLYNQHEGSVQSSSAEDDAMGDKLHRHGESVYGGFFDDEGFSFQHSRRGMVSMVRSLDAPNTNGSQFLITLGPVADLDGINVVFGEVCYGLDLLGTLNSLLTGSGGRRARTEGGSRGVGAGRPRELVSIIDSKVIEIPTAEEWTEQRAKVELAKKQQALDAYLQPGEKAWNDIPTAVAQGLQRRKRAKFNEERDEEQPIPEPPGKGKTHHPCAKPSAMLKLAQDYESD